MLKNFQLRTFQVSGCKRRFMCVKRKFPINAEDAKSLPIFDYGASKDSYRRVFVWGNIQTGALGVPYLKRKDPLAKIEFLKSPKRLGFAEKYSVSTVACGFGFTAFGVESKSEIKLYGTGLNTDSQIGYHAVRKGHPLEIIFFPQPIRLPLQNSTQTKIDKLSAGRAHLAVLTDKEGLFLLGNNSYGQCGRSVIENEDYLHSHYIHHIPTIAEKKIIDVECGQDHTLALTEDGKLFSCGWGADGQTGLGHYNNTSAFTQIRGDINGEKIIKMASKSDFVLALNENGEVFGWGNTEYGQINTKQEQVCHPTYLQSLKIAGKISDIASGGSFCVVLNSEGEVFVWGYGILGAGPRVQQSFHPIKLPETLFGKNDFQPDSKVVQVICGLNYAMAITNFGDIYAWGRNKYCCLGLGNDKDQFFPFKVSLGGHSIKVFCGLDHTVAICKPFI